MQQLFLYIDWNPVGFGVHRFVPQAPMQQQQQLSISRFDDRMFGSTSSISICCIVYLMLSKQVFHGTESSMLRKCI